MAPLWDGLTSIVPSLKCLDLFFEPTSSYSRSNVGNVYEEIALPWFDGAEPAEEERPVADAIRGLPETIASAIPTLQYLAISIQVDYYPIVMEDWYNDESDYDLHALDADVTWKVFKSFTEWE
ncbi:hypothetical protein OH76DRAFT_1421748 [Lentinus brumalis]|uniref:Uncharacterized protein n=1 Tax=Lentinus brumalis TaxID=2498619 RepID=A0A371CU79_9APHY|nr:hypothetical protein OH76DRAFT_1421748 [Polyporus brumalis]